MSGDSASSSATNVAASATNEEVKTFEDSGTALKYGYRAGDCRAVQTSRVLYEGAMRQVTDCHTHATIVCYSTLYLTTHTHTHIPFRTRTSIAQALQRRRGM